MKVLIEELPERLRVALKGKTSLYLTVQHFLAVDRLRSDMYLLNAYLDSDILTQAKTANGQTEIRLANGGRVIYMGGPSTLLDRRVRGLNVTHADNHSLLPMEQVHLVLRGG